MSAYEDAKAGWGFPLFAKDFPRSDELDALVVAFAEGDYAAVHEGAAKLEGHDDEAIRKAAAMLVDRTRPDPGARILFALATALLAFLTIWWVLHDGPPAGTQPSKTVPTTERN